MDSLSNVQPRPLLPTSFTDHLDAPSCMSQYTPSNISYHRSLPCGNQGGSELYPPMLLSTVKTARPVLRIYVSAFRPMSLPVNGAIMRLVVPYKASALTSALRQG